MSARTVGLVAVATMTALSLFAVFIGVHHQGSSGGGTLLVAISSKSGDRMPESQIQLHSARTGWSAVAHFGGGAVPAAPRTLTAVEAEVAPGGYDAIRFGARDLPAAIQVAAHRVEAVLVTVSSGQPDAAFAGNDDYNTGLLGLQGRLPQLPSFSLIDQDGQLVGDAPFRGGVLVLAAFHTSCRDTCPLYTAVLSQLSRRLPAGAHLLEVSTDPEHDSPAALHDHAALAAASWPLLTGTREQLAGFWGAFGVQLSGADAHSNFLGVFDAHGFLRHSETGIPDPGVVPGGLASLLSPEGVRELHSHGDGWGAAQVAEAMRSAGSSRSLAGGGQAPLFTAPLLDGGSVRLDGLRGTPLVLNFWASTCAPCRREMPLLQTEVGRTPARLLLIDVRDDPPAARGFLSQQGIHQSSVVDGDGRLAALYGVNVLPVTVFIRADGSIEGRYLGETSQAVLRDHLASLTAAG